MIYGLSSKFQGHFLVNNYLPTNLSDGFLDPSAFLDAVSRWQTAMEQLCYSCNAIHILVVVLCQLFFHAACWRD